MTVITDAILTHHQREAISKLPDYMQESTTAYILIGQKPGGFMRAVLSNDLYYAYARADDRNLIAMFQWAALLNHLPNASWGSKHAVDQWIERGGLVGMMEQPA